MLNKFSNKRVETIEILDSIDKNGRLEVVFQNNYDFDDDASYYVSLVSLETTSAIPNIDETNNKFYYSGSDNQLRTITFDEGAYEISQYNQVIKDDLIAKKLGDEDNIPISLDLIPMTGKMKLNLKNGFKVYFDEEKTWAKELGFETQVYDSTTISKNRVDILKTMKIFIYCNIVSGGSFNGKSGENILFSFPNNKLFGSVISYRPNPLQEKTLSNKHFNTLTLQFKNEKGESIDFMGMKVALTIEIKEV